MPYLLFVVKHHVYQEQVCLWTRAGPCTYSDCAGMLHMFSSMSFQLLMLLQDYLLRSVLTGCSYKSLDSAEFNTG